MPRAFGGGEREEPGAVGGWLVADACEGPVDRADAFVIAATGRAGEPAVVGQDGAYEEVDVFVLVGEAGGVEECFAVGGDTALALRVAETDEQLGPPAGIGLWGAVEQFERLAVPADGFVGCELGERVVAGDLGVVDRFRRVGRLDGGAPVIREFGGSCTGIVAQERFDRLRDGFVRPSASCRRKAVVERVFDERVRERVPVGISVVCNTAAVTAVSHTSITASSSICATAASRPMSKSRPITAPRARTRSVSGPSVARRRPITSRTLTGRPAARRSGSATQRPSSS